MPYWVSCGCLLLFEEINCVIIKPHGTWLKHYLRHLNVDLRYADNLCKWINGFSVLSSILELYTYFTYGKRALHNIYMG